MSHQFNDFINTIDSFKSTYREDINGSRYFGFPIEPIFEIESRLMDAAQKPTAYLSMEYGLAPSIYNSFRLKKKMHSDNEYFTHEIFSNEEDIDQKNKIKINRMLDIPIYGGGLGVLAADTIKSCADMHLPVVAVGVLWNKGYFRQKFWYKHGQIPRELRWNPQSYPGLIPLNHKIALETTEGTLHLRLWKYYIYSYDQKYAVPLILLDSNLPENKEGFQMMTDQLYRSDDVFFRLLQRTVLGVGGIKALDLLGYNIHRYHLNEGHAAMAVVEKFLQSKAQEEFREITKKFVYTCHTPVAAGHDRFAKHDFDQFLTSDYAKAAAQLGKDPLDDQLINLTHMCLNTCHGVNAVAKKHGEIMRLQFPDYAQKIKAITNGIHVHTWISKPFEKLFGKYHHTFGHWKEDPTHLSKADTLLGDENFRKDIFQAHQENKRNLIKVVKPWGLNEDVLTIGWARRITGYKRPALLFHDIEKIIDLAYNKGGLQILLSGKAHPNDDIGAAHIEEILDHIDRLHEHTDVIKVLILENYDTYFGKLLTNSVDLWLNNPLPPFEASGTSGMKAILNGVLQLSTLDGWVVEAQDADIGWIFGYQHKGTDIGSENDLRLDEDAQALCQSLAEVMDLYYQTNNRGTIDYSSPWITKMIHCITQSGYFNTQRMLKEYSQTMWENGV